MVNINFSQKFWQIWILGEENGLNDCFNLLDNFCYRLCFTYFHILLHTFPACTWMIIMLHSKLLIKRNSILVQVIMKVLTIYKRRKKTWQKWTVHTFISITGLTNLNIKLPSKNGDSNCGKFSKAASNRNDLGRVYTMHFLAVV
jgi:hypothetical protein